MPALPLLRDLDFKGVYEDRGVVISLFTAEGGIIDEASVLELFGHWTHGFFAYAVGIRIAAGYQRPTQNVELLFVSIPTFVFYLRCKRLPQRTEHETALIRHSAPGVARTSHFEVLAQMLINREALLRRTRTLASESEGDHTIHVTGGEYLLTTSSIVESFEELLSRFKHGRVQVPAEYLDKRAKCAKFWTTYIQASPCSKKYENALYTI